MSHFKGDRHRKKLLSLRQHAESLLLTTGSYWFNLCNGEQGRRNLNEEASHREAAYGGTEENDGVVDEANVHMASSSHDTPPSKRARIISTATPTEHPMAGLEPLLVDLNLATLLPAVLAWCAEQGIESVCELQEVGMEEDAFHDAH